MMMDRGMGFGMMWLFGALLLLGLVVLAVVVVKLLSRGDQRAPGTGRHAATSRGREILEERYARGEINTEEFQERLRNLEDPGR